jgi:hypothetical protein
LLERGIRRANEEALTFALPPKPAAPVAAIAHVYGGVKLVGMMFLFAAALSTEVIWPTYSNARFGYAICYPVALLRPQREAENGDGRKFTGADGAELLVFGQWNADARSLSDWAADEVQSYTGQRGRITYRVARSNWLVLSGNDGKGFEFYTKTIKRSDQFVTFQIKYPVAQSRVYRPVVKKLSGCLTLTRLPE